MLMLLYPLIGIVAGFFSGLLGLGGGLIIVPCLLVVFPLLGLEPSVHVAVGTSLATIVITLFSSARAHFKKGNQEIIKQQIRRFIPGIMIGTLLGTWIADLLSSPHLALIFGIVVWLLVIRMLLMNENNVPNSNNPADWHLPKLPGLTLVNILIGGVAALMGLGGGGFMVPFLQHCHVPMRIAIPIASICGIPVSILGTIGYMILGTHDPSIPAFSTGYVYWPAFVGIVMTSMFTAPLGAKLAHQLPASLLRWIFSIVLAIIGAKMIFFA
jgi:uncharacterized membrane protein YfcA